MKITFSNLFAAFGLICFIGMLILGTISDSERHRNKVKLYYQNGDISIEYFTTRHDNIKNYFKNGCIRDLYSKQICGVRSFEILEVKKVN